ncbi:hypothetical protein [Actinospica robiniae]|uniref:hypothetical protein n=1 Tax=Actinospica robiniae TaxID=304901 RepID=UPI0012FAF290|nr:hypothetical protein [Actinospica robiniae]
MTFTIMHRDGGMDDGDESAIPFLIAELDGEFDSEHPDVSVTEDESGWCLSYFQNELAVFENINGGDDGPRHMADVPREYALNLMFLVARGDISAVDQLAWRQGYGSR